MSRENWNKIKSSKGFYVRTYRQASMAVTVSLIFNLLLLLAIYYYHINRPSPDFYATNGTTPPVKLTALDERNYSSTPLLEADPVNEDKPKVIPQ